MKKLLLFIALIAISGNLFAGSPRLGLVEAVTSGNCGPCKPASEHLNAYLDANPNKAVGIIYHSGNGSAEPLYDHNPGILSGRIFNFYVSGSFGTPMAVANGTRQGSFYDYEGEINKNSGKTSPISIFVIEDRGANSTELTVIVESDVVVTGNKKMFMAVCESNIILSPPLNNGESIAHRIARKMIPSPSPASAQVLNLDPGQRKTFKYTFNHHSDWDMNEIFVVAVVQDMGTKEVLQCAETMPDNLTAPKITLAETKLEFGDVANKKTMAATIGNEGLRSLKFSNISIVDDPNNCFEMLTEEFENVDSGSEIEVQVIFRPADNENYTARIKIESNAGNPVYINLTGTGKDVITGPNLFCDYTELDFGIVQYATEKILEVENTGKQDVEISSVTVGGADAAAFRVLNDSFSPIEPNDAYEINIEFIPTEDREYLAEIIIASNTASGNDMVVTVKGTGEGTVSGAALASDLEIIDFGVCSESKIKTLVISNPGHAELKITGVTFDPNADMEFTLANTELPIIIPTGDEQEISIQFDPPTNRIYTGDMTFVCNAGNASKFEVRLTAEGKNVVTKAIVASDMEAVDFGEVGEMTTKTVTVTNMGYSMLFLYSAEIIDDDEGIFSLEDFTLKNLTHGKTFEFVVEATPGTTEGLFKAKLEITSNADAGDFVIPLSVTISLVSVEDGNDLATGQLTMEALPNPLTSNSIVKCTLSGDQPRSVKVDIFDMKGSKIANIFDGSMTQGENILRLNDIPPVSGSYIIVAEINGNITVLPVVFVK